MSDQPKQKPVLQVMPLIAPVTTVPGPMPTEVAVDRIADPRGTPIVVMQVCTHSGVQFYFFSQESAKKIAKALDEAAGGVLVMASGILPK